MNKKTKQLLCLLIIAAMLFSLASCGQKSENTPQKGSTAYPLTITDDFNNKITIESKPVKIVSSSPSITEILYALGLDKNIVGVSASCDWPVDAQTKPKLFEFAGPDIESIIAADPDIILSDVAYGIPKDTQLLLEQSGIKIVLMTYTSAQDVLDNILLIGQITDKNKEALSLVESINKTIDEYKAKAENQDPKSVFIDIGGFYTPAADTYMDDLLKIIGAQNIAGDLAKGWVAISLEKLVEKNPDVYIDLSVEKSGDLPANSIAADLPAVKNNNFYSYSYSSNETSILSRPGPRIDEALQLLYEIIYQDVK